jgi:hypothetical protein
LVVSFAECSGPDYKPFTGKRLGGKPASVHHGLHGSDREPAKLQAFRDQGLGLFAGSGTRSRISRHELDVIDKSPILLRELPFLPQQSVIYLKET